MILGHMAVIKVWLGVQECARQGRIAGGETKGVLSDMKSGRAYCHESSNSFIVLTRKSIENISAHRMIISWEKHNTRAIEESELGLPSALAFS